MGQSFLLNLLLLVAACSTVPLTSQRRRIKRENENPLGNTTIPENGCLLDNQTYERGQEVPSLGPCEKCLCEAPDVVCSMIKCQPNSGCRTIQQSGQCCPEYKCDCEYNNRVYNNGERLDKPEDPCQVCYCKGGEIMCTSITCYERDDCKPLYIPGQCCPKYDHCPIESNRGSGNSVRSVNSSAYSPKREMQPWPLTKSSNHHTSVSYEETSSSPNIYPQTIRIVEILPTTPGYDNKPSEVSVVPRIKTTEQNENKLSDEPPKETISTSEGPSELPSSTSEIEHLLQTTAETEVVRSETTATDNLKSTTLNPLAESVDPETLPDSYKFSTVFPNYYYTEGNLNYVEEQTTDIFNETEGSGYVLLTGGMFEEVSTMGAYDNAESTTESLAVLKVSEINLSTNGSEDLKQGDQPSVDIFDSTTPGITTEIPIINEEYEKNNTSLVEKCQDCSTNIEEESTSSLSSSENGSDESSDVSNDEIKNSTYHLESDRQPEELFNTSSTPKNSNGKLVVEETLTTTFEPLITDISPTSNLKNENSTIEESEITEIGTEPSDIIQVSLVESHETVTDLIERKRETVGSYRNLDITSSTKSGTSESEQLFEIMNDSNQEEVPTMAPLISFPPVLNLHTLDYSEMSPFIENKSTDILSSMAKVEIYHPIKPNESASYLTVVDDKNNITHVNNDGQPSHMLLTPDDLKKLAEILIHEKIKPAHSKDENEIINNETSVNPTDYNKSPEQLVTENLRIMTRDKDAEISPSMEKNYSTTDLSEYNITEVTERNLQITRNNENTSNSFETFSTAIGYETSASDKIESSTIQMENLRTSTPSSEVTQNTVSAVTEKYFEDLVNDDPNTSRKIRVPENANQFTALLDDKDLLILENFFKKNMGLH